MPIRRRHLIGLADGSQVPQVTDGPFIRRPNAEAMIGIRRRAGQRPVALIGAAFRRGHAASLCCGQATAFKARGRRNRTAKAALLQAVDADTKGWIARSCLHGASDSASASASAGDSAGDSASDSAGDSDSDSASASASAGAAAERGDGVSVRIRAWAAKQAGLY